MCVCVCIQIVVRIIYWKRVRQRQMNKAGKEAEKKMNKKSQHTSHTKEHVRRRKWH